jgi:hypothetical protein
MANPFPRTEPAWGLRAYLVLMGCAADRQTVTYDDLARRINRDDPDVASALSNVRFASDADVVHSLRLVDKAHMRGDDAPAFRKANPGLHLSADFPGQAGAMKQRRGDGVVAAVSTDDSF